MGHVCDPIARVKSAKHGECTPRVEQLAKNKDVPKGYEHEKPTPRPVPNSAKNAAATSRTVELAKPRVKYNKDDTTEDDLYRVRKDIWM